MKKVIFLSLICFILVGCSDSGKMKCTMKDNDTSYEQILYYEGKNINKVKITTKKTYANKETLNTDYNAYKEDKSVSVNGLTMIKTYEQEYNDEQEVKKIISQLEKLGFSCK